MKQKTMRFLAIATLALGGLAATAQQSDVKDKIMAAMAGDLRTEAEVERDRNRIDRKSVV